MDSQAKSGALSILTALAAAIAPAVAKAVIARRSRAPIKAEEQSMCRNHSHVAGHLLDLTPGLDNTVVSILVEQPLTVELSTGGKLTLPPYTVLSLQQAHPGAWSDSELRATAVRAAAELSKAGQVITSGLTTRPR